MGLRVLDRVRKNFEEVSLDMVTVLLWVLQLFPNLVEFVCLLQDASGHSNVLKAGKAEELKNARKRRTARKAN